MQIIALADMGDDLKLCPRIYIFTEGCRRGRLSQVGLAGGFLGDAINGARRIVVDQDLRTGTNADIVRGAQGVDDGLNARGVQYRECGPSTQEVGSGAGQKVELGKAEGSGRAVVTPFVDVIQLDTQVVVLVLSDFDNHRTHRYLLAANVQFVY